MKPFMFIIIALMLIGICSNVSAEPTAKEVYNTMLNMWNKHEVNQLETYINTLYKKYPSYIPAILAKAFHEYIYEGELLSAKNKLLSVKDYLKSNFSPEMQGFLDKLSKVIDEIEGEIAWYESRGTVAEKIKAAASTEAVKSISGSMPPPIFSSISNAPNMSISR